MDAVHRGCWSAAGPPGIARSSQPVPPAGHPTAPFDPALSALRGHGAALEHLFAFASIRYHSDDARLPPRRPLRADRRSAARDRSPRGRAGPGSEAPDAPRRDRHGQDVHDRPHDRGHGKPTLVLAHNKTLAAQLYAEFREFFPDNAVEYFVSYFDYYQPEAYLPRSDTYIEKDSSRNDEIDRLRHAATHALFERRDVIIVASVSCIYGLGAPVDYGATVLASAQGGSYRRDTVLRQLVDLQYQRNDQSLTRARFRVRGDTLEFQPASEETLVRVEFFGDEVERITEVDPLTGELLARAQGGQRLPGEPLRDAGRQAEAGDRRHRGRDGGAGRPARGGGPGAGRGPPPAADDVRPGDDARARVLHRDRELLAASLAPRGRLPAVDAARLLPAGLAARRRRVAHDDPPGRRHVQERPDAEGDPRRLRVPPAVRARQPAADVRRVRGPSEPGRSTCRRRRARTSSSGAIGSSSS